LKPVRPWSRPGGRARSPGGACCQPGPGAGQAAGLGHLEALVANQALEPARRPGSVTWRRLLPTRPWRRPGGRPGPCGQAVGQARVARQPVRPLWPGSRPGPCGQARLGGQMARCRCALARSCPSGRPGRRRGPPVSSGAPTGAFKTSSA
jgi:hypothetical protein